MKAIERKRKRTTEYVRNCSVTDLVEAITEKTVTEHLLAVFSTCLCTKTIICSQDNLKFYLRKGRRFGTKIGLKFYVWSRIEPAIGVSSLS